MKMVISVMKMGLLLVQTMKKQQLQWFIKNIQFHNVVSKEYCDNNDATDARIQRCTITKANQFESDIVYTCLDEFDPPSQETLQRIEEGNKNVIKGFMDDQEQTLILPPCVNSLTEAGS